MAANETFSTLLNLLEAMSENERNASFEFGHDFLQKQKEAHWTRDNNIRDVLAHLYEWHRLLLNWIQANQQGDPKPFLPTPYNWKTYGEMNSGFWQKHQNIPYDDAKVMVKNSHDKVMEWIDHFSDQALFSKKHFPWTGTATLGSYCISATSSHYDWAIKKIKRHLKTYVAHPKTP